MAVQNSFPNWARTAELEFIKRLALCTERQNIDLRVTDCSADILRSGADFVLTLHEVSPKLTRVPTIGAMWNPPSGIRNDPTRCEYIRSYDGYLPASSAVESFIAQQNSECSGPEKPVANFRFYPTSPARVAQATSYQSLVYLGVHWDGHRHGEFLKSLARDGTVALYGPKEAWKYAGNAYHGTIPFDGVSVIHRIAKHGIVLCMHRDPHRADNTPSMRLFEAASAGCLIISDGIPFARETFGDTIFILPESDDRADFTKEILAWARANPNKARDMARSSQAIFERQCSLDALLPKIMRFGNSVASLHRRPRLRPLLWRARDRIDVIYLAREGDPEGIMSAISTMNAQTHNEIRLVVVHGGLYNTTAISSTQLRRGLQIVELRARNPDVTIYEALAEHIVSDFATVLTHDHIWEPHHLATLKTALTRDNEAQAARATRVLIARKGTLLTAPNLLGDLDRIIQEDRVLETSLDLTQNSSFARDDEKQADLLSILSPWLLRAKTFRRLLMAGERHSKPALANGGGVTESLPLGLPRYDVIWQGENLLKHSRSGWVSLYQKRVSSSKLPEIRFV